MNTALCESKDNQNHQQKELLLNSQPTIDRKPQVSYIYSQPFNSEKTRYSFDYLKKSALVQKISKLSHLEVKINTHLWTNKEDWELYLLHHIHGNNWDEISREFPGKSSVTLEYHWNTHLKKNIGVQNFRLKKILRKLPDHSKVAFRGLTHRQSKMVKKIFKKKNGLIAFEPSVEDLKSTVSEKSLKKTDLEILEPKLQTFSSEKELNALISFVENNKLTFDQCRNLSSYIDQNEAKILYEKTEFPLHSEIIEESYSYANLDPKQNSQVNRVTRPTGMNTEELPKYEYYGSSELPVNNHPNLNLPSIDNNVKTLNQESNNAESYNNNQISQPPQPFFQVVPLMIPMYPPVIYNRRVNIIPMMNCFPTMNPQMMYWNQQCANQNPRPL